MPKKSDLAAEAVPEDLKVNQISKDAPIIPFEGMGGIKLYSSMDSLNSILLSDGVALRILNDLWLRYDIQNCIELFFHRKNQKLFRITTLEQYTGKLWGRIAVGMTVKEMLVTEPGFRYDEFEEVWESPKGVFIETDAVTNQVKWISVYIKELDLEDFDLAKW